MAEPAVSTAVHVEGPVAVLGAGVEGAVPGAPQVQGSPEDTQVIGGAVIGAGKRGAIETSNTAGPCACTQTGQSWGLSLIHISEPTRPP